MWIMWIVWTRTRWFILGSAFLLMLSAPLMTYLARHWVFELGPPRDQILIYLPELRGEPLAINPPGRIGVLGTTHPITTEKRETSHSKSTGRDFSGRKSTISSTTTIITHTRENVKVEGAQYTGQREYDVKRGEKTYKVLLAWSKGEYKIYVDGRKVRRRFFRAY